MQKYEDYWNTFPSIHTHWPPKFLQKILMRDDFLHDAGLISAKIITDIQMAKELGADVVVLIPHMGVEFTQYPLKFARDMVNKWFNAGADIIIGGHPHVLQPMECRNIVDLDGNQRTGYVIYSLGNFVANGYPDWPSEKCYSSIILNLTIERNKSETVFIKEITYTPTIIHMTDVGGERKSITISIHDLYNKAANVNDISLCQKLVETNSEVLSDLHLMGGGWPA